MFDFLKTPWGLAIFIVVVAAAVIFIIDVNYKYFTKRVLDFIFALVGVIIFSPLLVVLAIASKVREDRVFEEVTALGYKGRVVVLHDFAGFENGIKSFARLFDILSGKLSFVGVQPLALCDGALLDDEQFDRFNAKPGLACHLVMGGKSTLTYEEALELDIKYAKKRELFRDIYIFLKNFVYLLRGEKGSYLGETKSKSYADILISQGKITEEDKEEALKAVEKAENDRVKADDFHAKKYK